MKTANNFGNFWDNRLKQRLGFGLFTGMAALTILPIIVVIIFIVVKGFPAISWDFISQMPTNGMRSGGILPAIIGTCYLTIGTAIFFGSLRGGCCNLPGRIRKG